MLLAAHCPSANPAAKSLGVFLHGPANLRARCSKHGNGYGCRMCQTWSAWRQTPARHWPLHVANPSARQRPRFKTPRPHIREHAPENTQNHTARLFYPSHIRLTSPQLPCPAAYVPDRPICPTIGWNEALAFFVAWSGQPARLWYKWGRFTGNIEYKLCLVSQPVFLVQKPENQLCMKKLTKPRV